MNISTIDHETLREVVRKSRRQSWVVKHKWLVLFVGVPTLLAAIYYGLIASPVYVSESSFVIKSPGQKSSPTLSLANLVQTSGLSSGQEQTKEVLEYIPRHPKLLRPWNFHAGAPGRGSYVGRTRTGEPTR